MDSKIVEYYSRREVQEAIVRECSGREVGVKYGDKGFGKRPQILSFEGDVLQLAKGGVTSFHISEERWKDPLKLKSGLVRKQLDELRSGWDLVLDIDTDYFEFARLCALNLVEALRFYDVNCFGLKFSGRSGIHIGIPFEAFPKTVNNQEIRLLFPEGVRMVASYLKNMIQKKLAEDILDKNTIEELAKVQGKKVEELKTKGIFDPYNVVDVDSVLISSRHMFRAPYSINEKSGLVSIPLTVETLKKFTLRDAKMENVSVDLRFIDPKKVNTPDEAKHLLIESFDWSSKNMVTPMEEKDKKKERKYEVYTEAIPEKFFPPCILELLKGVKKDGRKRTVFVLIQFLRNMAWPLDKIQETLLEWNKKNYEPLPEGYIISQINWHKKQKEVLPPPNCTNESYYVALEVCKPDNCCKGIKNPLQYVHRKMRQVKKKRRKK